MYSCKRVKSPRSKFRVTLEGIGLKWQLKNGAILNNKKVYEGLSSSRANCCLIGTNVVYRSRVVPVDGERIPPRYSPLVAKDG